MLRRILAFLALAGLFLIGPSPSYAACKWVWDCSGEGPCQHKPVCQSSIDIVPPEPPDVPPVTPMRPIKPIVPPRIPPPGAQTCEQRYICSGGGQCAWRRVCE
ncbi:MAG TPA: hypothetical protein VGM25_16835 [Caulobacteraceae bacterium]|jgi:hypothetical protein